MEGGSENISDKILFRYVLGFKYFNTSMESILDHRKENLKKKIYSNMGI